MVENTRSITDIIARNDAATNLHIFKYDIVPGTPWRRFLSICFRRIGKKSQKYAHGTQIKIVWRKHNDTSGSDVFHDSVLLKNGLLLAPHTLLNWSTYVSFISVSEVELSITV